MDYFEKVSDFWFERCSASTAKTLEFKTGATKVSFDYEIIWEDDDPASADWVQAEFDYFWDHECAVPLCEFVISDIKRIADRHPLTVRDWREKESADPAAVAAEEPVYRSEFGLWAHQKYFVMRAFEEHRTKGGARLVLADMVGLGKTLQLAMTAKLMALYGDRPILIIVPNGKVDGALW